MSVLFLSYTTILATLITAVSPHSGPPKHTISNGLVTAEVLLPDAEKGYYRAARFDWSGVISQLDYKGHSYFGKWFDKYDPTHHDAIMGPVDEFREPLGFEEASVGGEFIKIGVGVLKKTEDAKYSFSKKYPVTNSGIWKVSTEKDKITFSQELKTSLGFSYHYQKIVRLAPNKAALTIEHQLTNTGTKAIHSSTYNHNFFMIDNEPTGPNIHTSFDVDIEATGRGFGDLAHARNKSIVYTRQLQKGENVFSEDLKINKGIPEKYAFQVENTKTGAGVRVIGNKAIDTLVYWACATTACPEPYINLSLKPGATTRWDITYEFYTK